MNSKIKLIVFSVGLIGLLMVGNLALAQPQNPTGLPEVGPTTVSGAVGVLTNVVRWVYIIFFIVAVLFILFAAFTYLGAGGNEDKIAKAKNQIIYAAVAIIVALLAVGFQTIVIDFLTTTPAV